MKLWIPDIGDQFRLDEDWEFPLFRQRLNDTMLTRVNPILGPVGYGRSNAEESIGCLLAAGTVLQVDRVYVRKGKGDYSSITFYVKHHPGDKDRPKYKKQRVAYGVEPPDRSNIDPTPQKLKGARFWAKLDDVNEIVCTPIDPEDKL